MASIGAYIPTLKPPPYPQIVAWLKSYGKGYQSRINSILRNAMTAEKQAVQQRG